MPAPDVAASTMPLDVIAAVDGEKVIAELDIRHNATARVGDQYMIRCTDGALIILRVESFRSAEEYSNTIARRIEAMREGVAGEPATPSARKAYQTKLAILRIEGELLPDGTRRIGAYRTPEVMVPLLPLSDDALEQFATSLDGNLLLGNLCSGRRLLNRPARIRHDFAGGRMLILGMPGKGKTQEVRSLLSQAMGDDSPPPASGGGAAAPDKS
jgi:hypothetical protein